MPDGPDPAGRPCLLIEPTVRNYTPNVAPADPIALDLPITTKRLILRGPVPSDAAPLHARRNEPAVAAWQSWAIPFPWDRADAMVKAAAAMSGPTPGEWWMVTVETQPAEPDGGAVAGDVAVRLDPSGTVAEIGYGLAPRFWGRGYATEAVAAVIDALFAAGPALVRIEARMHPDNLASASVVERCGFRYEGRTRLSFPSRYESEPNTDDLIYGLTRADRAEWLGRPTSPPVDVALVEISHDMLDTVFELKTHKSQEQLVSPVLHSLAEALHTPVRHGVAIESWHRAVSADGLIVGFVMMAFPPDRPAYLWRMLIDRLHQRRGIGRRVLDLVVAEARRRGSTELAVSWAPDHGSPEPFYVGYGFRPVGEPDGDGEIPGILSI